MSIFLYFILLIILLFFMYKLLSKINFNLNGLEIIIFQLSFLFMFHIGRYYNYYMFDFISKEGVIIFIILLYYYLLKTIKAQIYTKLRIFALYIAVIIIDFFSIEFIHFEDWDGLGYYAIYIVGCIVILLYILLMNFISFIIKKHKKEKLSSLESIELIQNKNLKVGIIISIIFFPLIYAYIGDKLYDYFEKQRITKAHEVAINYLDDKYKFNNINIIETEEDGGCVFLGGCHPYTYNIIFDLNYIDNNFIVKVNKGTYEIENEEEIDYEFKFFYLSKLIGKDIEEYDELEPYFVNELENNINEKIKDYNAKVQLEINFDNNVLYDMSYREVSTLKSIFELENIIKLTGISLVINEDFNSNELEEFTNYIIDLYEKTKKIYFEYNHVGNLSTLHFDFDSGNPFYKESIHYKDSGYIRDASSIYRIYVDSTPIKIDK